ncbi:hypothetical protein EGW08_003820, partial [Elysia chlorotica]
MDSLITKSKKMLNVDYQDPSSSQDFISSSIQYPSMCDSHPLSSRGNVKDLLASYLDVFETEAERTAQSSVASRKHRLETQLDFYSPRAWNEMKELMDSMAESYAQRFDQRAKRDKVSTISSYHIQEGIGQLGLLHPTLTCMNLVCIGHPLIQYDAFVGKSFLRKHKIKMGEIYVKPRDSTFLSDFMEFVQDMPKCGGDSVK